MDKIIREKKPDLPGVGEKRRSQSSLVRVRREEASPPW
jgi:hypothetical protein